MPLEEYQREYTTALDEYGVIKREYATALEEYGVIQLNLTDILAELNRTTQEGVAMMNEMHEASTRQWRAEVAFATAHSIAMRVMLVVFLIALVFVMYRVDAVVREVDEIEKGKLPLEDARAEQPNSDLDTR